MTKRTEEDAGCGQELVMRGMPVMMSIDLAQP